MLYRKGNTEPACGMAVDIDPPPKFTFHITAANQMLNHVAYFPYSVLVLKYQQTKFNIYTASMTFSHIIHHTRVNPKVFGLAAWSENSKWYSSLPLGAVVSQFCESV
jgi:hypothetical protein